MYSIVLLKKIRIINPVKITVKKYNGYFIVCSINKTSGNKIIVTIKKIFNVNEIFDNFGFTVNSAPSTFIIDFRHLKAPKCISSNFGINASWK